MYEIKAILVGDQGVGKTCIATRACSDEYKADQQPTIGATHMTLSVRTDKSIVVFSIWDTAGQETYRTLLPLYFHGAAAAVLVFDVTSRSSFANLPEWLELLHQHAPDDCEVMLVGNKADLEDRRQVELEEVVAYLGEIGGINYLETSAQTGQNIKEIFQQIALSVSVRRERIGVPDLHLVATVDLKPTGEERNQGSGCQFFKNPIEWFKKRIYRE